MNAIVNIPSAAAVATIGASYCGFVARLRLAKSLALTNNVKYINYDAFLMALFAAAGLIPTDGSCSEKALALASRGTISQSSSIDIYELVD